MSDTTLGQLQPGPIMNTVNAELARQYMELLMAVSRKFPGETRHQTALRYINEAENRANDYSPASELNKQS